MESEFISLEDYSTTLRMYTHANDDSTRKAGQAFRDALKKDSC